MVPQLAVLRGFRVPLMLRPLNASKTFQRTRLLLKRVFVSMKHMPIILTFVTYLYMMFSILAVHQFVGDFFNHCRLTPQPVYGVWPLDRSVYRLCTLDNYGEYVCPVGEYCGNIDQYNLPVESDNSSSLAGVYYGSVGFDNIFIGVLTVYQVVTLEGWTDIMYQMGDSENQVFSPIYFHILVYIGSYFALNLILASIIESFQEEKEEEEEEKEEVTETVSPLSCPQAPRNDLEIKPINIMQEKDITIQGSPIFSKKILVDNYTKEAGNNEGISGKIIEFCSELSKTATFQAFIIACIVGNMVVLSADRFPIDLNELRVWDSINTAFFVVFWVEMIVMIIATKIKEYVWDKYNVLDAIINFLGIIEIGLTYSNLRSEYSVNVVIVIIRLSRITKLIGKWQFLEEMLTLFLYSLIDVADFALLMVLFMFVYSLIGMELFANIVKFNNNDQIDLINGISQRVNFDNLGYSMLSLFTLTVGDNWNQYFYEYTRINSPASVFYFITTGIIFNLLLLNLFLALFMEHFFEDEEKDKMEEEENKNLEYAKSKKKLKEAMGEKNKGPKIETMMGIMKQFSFIKTIKTHSQTFIVPSKGKAKVALEGFSFEIFGPDHPVRLFVSKVVRHKYFNYFVYTVIATNTIALTFHTPLLPPGGVVLQQLLIVDAVTISLMGVEIILKSITYGLVTNGPGSYLRDPWNALDLTICIVTIVGMPLATAPDAVKTVFRTLRALRILRIITMSQDFRVFSFRFNL